MVAHVDALARIKELVKRGDVRFTFHARQRMDERDATERDVCNALLGGTQAAHDISKDTYRVSGGCDIDGDDLTVVVAIEADAIVITLF